MAGQRNIIEVSRKLRLLNEFFAQQSLHLRMTCSILTWDTKPCFVAQEMSEKLTRDINSLMKSLSDVQMEGELPFFRKGDSLIHKQF